MMLPLPTIIFGILLSTLEAAVYHMVRGGKSSKFAMFLILAWIGFWLGDYLGWYLSWSFMAVGLLNAGMGALGSFVLMLAGDLISVAAGDAPQKE
ncbi:MAG: hypothetical protein WCK35_09770 [Chloroflexota bacterium]